MNVAHCELDGNADAVEFCPHRPYHHVLAAATYTLQEGTQPRRSGSISLFDVNVDENRFELVHRLETAGIFDVKWNFASSNMDPMLAQADANGCLKIYRLGSLNGEKEDILRDINSKKISDSMCLCLDWNPVATSIVSGLSDGSVSIVSFSNSQLHVNQEWKAHDFELWTTCFDTHQPHLIYTGSDDCKFSCWDLRDSPANVVFQNSRVHKMGVCCIAKNPDNPNSLITGSYDEYLRVWDLRSISRPLIETSICLGGGVWRVKYHPYLPNLVLAACMHNGVGIIRIGGDECEVVERYEKHGSIAYGADWQRGELSQDGKRKNNAVASCSFYDRLLRVWIPQNDSTS